MTLHRQRVNTSEGLYFHINKIKPATGAQFQVPGAQGGAVRTKVNTCITRSKTVSVKCAESGETVDGRAPGIGPWVTACRDQQHLGAGHAGCEGSSRLFCPLLTNHLYWFHSEARERERELQRRNLYVEI